MTPLNRESVVYKLERIRSNLRELKKLAKMPYKEYSGGIEHQMTAERLLQVNIQAMLDVGNHIVAEEGLPAPLEYRDVFKTLEKQKILSPQLSSACRSMVGLRNRLVHDYDEIDHKLIYGFLKKNLGDFDLFIRAITRYIRK